MAEAAPRGGHFGLPLVRPFSDEMASNGGFALWASHFDPESSGAFVVRFWCVRMTEIYDASSSRLMLA
jgi:hypothetical protein